MISFIFEMGNILYKKWVVFVTQKRFGYREKGVYLPIVLYLSTSKIKVP